MKILDCTLRDGGYYTDWFFDSSLVEIYLKTISNSPIDIIELGYISNQKDYYGPFFHLNNNLINFSRKFIRMNQKIFVMVNTKEISNYNDLYNLLKKNYISFDGVRFAVQPKDIPLLSELILKIKKKIKKIDVHFNIMYASEWCKNEELVIKLIDQSRKSADAISIVDSYGAFIPKEVSTIFELIKAKRPEVKIGSHFHNNCGLALANTIEAINSGADFVDTTFKGMGRGAGNAETELLMAYLNKTKIKEGFSIDSLVLKLSEMQTKLKWGSSYAYSYAARNGFSQSEMMDLVQKRRLEPGVAITKINKQNKVSIKSIKFSNLKILKKNKFHRSNVVIIGGAETFHEVGLFFLNKLSINTLLILTGNNALINLDKISKNYNIKNPIILLLTGSEFNKISYNKLFFKKINLISVVVESQFVSNKIYSYFRKKIILSNSVAENPLLLGGMLLKKLKIRNFYTAFFDGNAGTEKEKILMKETEESIIFLKKIGMEIETYTKSYLPLKRKNIWLA